MTIGEKIKEARKSEGLTQEQMAEKLMISYQKITKWESDQEIPDVDNLKAISSLLNVSIDYLLDNEQDIDTSIIREKIDLSKYKKNAKDQIIMEKYPETEIWLLIAEQKLTKGEKIIDNILGFIFDAPFGIPGLANGLKNSNKSFYLVNKDNKQYFVMITNELIESREMTKPLTEKKFEIGNMKFIKSNYRVKNKKR
ncbi:helix-turn-helix domain-containing protein [Acetobacterium woodii]|uniref:Putative helix-turn-helix domain protein n=1 Tax=Acetobacterium woodii (strain ATCC 29683 / DSM 1030 / JCM 2381 / KCTC 1655 / WB1) TaxID=931626 RepID=H6LIA3_ACEWD|nr:helix-turn-helix transcriptional regulator [Acetobacterium woodii]AFA47277.1 putative helix-turn-helix domain protein [Acetobacterium woodii DSM 1030]